MIGFGPNSEEVLRKKYSQGLRNGVRGLRFLSGEEVLALEPGLNPGVRVGLFAPEAGTVIPWELGLAAAENAVHNGVEIRRNTKVTAVEKAENGYVLGAGGGRIFSRGIVNCAGLFADEIMNIPEKLDFIKDEDVPQMVEWALKEANPIYPVPVIWDAEQFTKTINRIRTVPAAAAAAK